MPLSDAERLGAEGWWGAHTGATRLFVNLSASGPERRWSNAHFVSVPQALRRRANTRVIVAGEHDVHDIAEFAVIEALDVAVAEGRR